MGYPSPELRALNTRAIDGRTSLTERAKASGTLRADFTPEDIILLLEAIAGIIRQTGTAASAATERFVALALDGLRADAATPAPPPITRRQIRAERSESRRARSANARTHPPPRRPGIDLASPAPWLGECADPCLSLAELTVPAPVRVPERAEPESVPGPGACKFAAADLGEAVVRGGRDLAPQSSELGARGGQAREFVQVRRPVAQKKRRKTARGFRNAGQVRESDGKRRDRRSSS